MRIVMVNFELQDVLRWLRGQSLQNLSLILQEVVSLVLERAMAIAEVDELEDAPDQGTIQDIIGQTLVSRGWTLALLAQNVRVLLPRLRQIQDGDCPSSEELEALRQVLVKMGSATGWTLPELERLVARQYGGEYKNIRQLVIRNWDQLTEAKISLNRLEEIREGDRPTEAEILRLAQQLNLDEDYIIDLVDGKINGNGIQV